MLTSLVCHRLKVSAICSSVLIALHAGRKPSPLSTLQLKQFVSGWIAHGVPSKITTDCGRQFESTLWEQLTRLLGIQWIHTMAYHPIANGPVEYFHRQLKAALKTYSTPEKWTIALPVVLHVIHTALKEDLPVPLQSFVMT